MAGPSHTMTVATPTSCPERTGHGPIIGPPPSAVSLVVPPRLPAGPAHRPPLAATAGRTAVRPRPTHRHVLVPARRHHRRVPTRLPRRPRRRPAGRHDGRRRLG